MFIAKRKRKSFGFGYGICSKNLYKNTKNMGTCMVKLIMSRREREHFFACEMLKNVEVQPSKF
jgi:hypothetical protein